MAELFELRLAQGTLTDIYWNEFVMFCRVFEDKASDICVNYFTLWFDSFSRKSRAFSGKSRAFLEKALLFPKLGTKTLIR
jgi:hypothetical protein